MYALDLWLFMQLHALAGHFAFVDFLIVFFGQYVLYIILLYFSYRVYVAYKKNDARLNDYLLALIAAITARFGVATTIYALFPRLRPFASLQLPHLLNPATPSFPSGHAILIFALATGMYSFDKKCAYVLYVLGILVGIARVMGGVHYPSDILFGAILGILTGYCVGLAWNMLRNRTVHPIIQQK